MAATVTRARYCLETSQNSGKQSAKAWLKWEVHGRSKGSKRNNTQDCLRDQAGRYLASQVAPQEELLQDTTEVVGLELGPDMTRPEK